MQAGVGGDNCAKLRGVSVARQRGSEASTEYGQIVGTEAVAGSGQCPHHLPLHSQQIDTVNTVNTLYTVNMKLGTMDPALACSGPMSTFSYDSHPISRARWVLPSRAANEPSAKFAALIKPSCSSDHCSGCLMWRAVQVRGRG